MAKTFRQLQKEIHKNAIEHGWWDNKREFGTLISLCHTELSEAFEAFRDGANPAEVFIDPESGKPEGIGVELADTVIRIMDTCEFYGIDLIALIEQKHEYNKTRPFKHGGKRV